MAQEELILLDYYYSMFAMRAKIALAEKGLEYELKAGSVFNKSSLLLEMNPIHKKFPVLIHNGKPICESLIILQYIDEVWKDNGLRLMPEDPYERSQARFWADLIDKKVYSSGFGVWATLGEEKEASTIALIEAFKLLEGQLGDKPFFGGENFGYLDVALIPYSSWIPVYEIHGNFSTEEHCPKLIEWAKRCMEKESVSKSLADPQKLAEYAIMLRKKFGVED